MAHVSQERITELNAKVGRFQDYGLSPDVALSIVALTEGYIRFEWVNNSRCVHINAETHEMLVCSYDKGIFE